MRTVNETTGSRAENLEIIKLNNNDYIAKLESITVKPSAEEITALGRELEMLCSYTNSGAYGAMSDQYQAENNRLAACWIPFCDKVGI